LRVSSGKTILLEINEGTAKFLEEFRNGR